jgi:hypothetical protein
MPGDLFRASLQFHPYTGESKMLCLSGVRYLPPHATVSFPAQQRFRHYTRNDMRV